MTTFHVRLFAALLLAGCGSPPKLVMPDGASRFPVNSQTDIDHYIAKSRRQSGEMRERTESDRQVEAVKRDVATLKLYMAAMAAQLESSPGSQANFAPAIPTATQSVGRNAKPGQTALAAEAIRIGEDSLVFRVMFSAGRSTFTPSVDFSQKLLKAANEGRQIEIRSASDSSIPSTANDRVLKERVDSARQYLIANGISPAKIKTRYFDAGAFIADNASAEGRSKNRRTEIEIKGLGAAAHRESEKQQGGAAQ